MLDQIKANFVYILLGILALNIVVLDYVAFFGKPKQVIQNISLGSAPILGSTPTQDTPSTPTQQTAAAQGSACPVMCMDAIKAATASLKLNPTIIVPTTAPVAAPSGGSNEYFVPFGAASGASQGSFTNVGGLQAYVNMSEYSSVSTVVFEVTVGGSGIVTVQLYDATDGYVIPNSTVTMPGGSPQLLVSSPLTMPPGNKLYQVQVQTQLNAPAIINQARLHITTN